MSFKDNFPTSKGWIHHVLHKIQSGEWQLDWLINHLTGEHPVNYEVGHFKDGKNRCHLIMRKRLHLSTQKSN